MSDYHTPRSATKRYLDGGQQRYHQVNMLFENIQKSAEFALIPGALAGMSAGALSVLLTGSHPIATLAGLAAYSYSDRTMLRGALNAALTKVPAVRGLLPTRMLTWLDDAPTAYNLKQSMISVSIAAGVIAGVSMLVGWHALPTFWGLNVARVQLFLGSGSTDELIRLHALTRDPSVLATYNAYFGMWAYVAGAVSAVTAYFGMKREIKKALELEADQKPKHMRGLKVITKQELIDQVNSVDEDRGWCGANPDYNWCGMPLGRDHLMKNFWVVGTVGSGKTQALLNLTDQLATKNVTLTIYDITGEFTEYFYRGSEKKDVVFCPFDARFPGWNVFNEIRQKTDMDQLAKWLIPITEPNNTNHVYFVGSAQIVFACVLEKLIEEKRTTHADLLSALACPQAELYEWLGDSRAADVLNPKSESTGGAGVLTSLKQNLDVLRYVSDGPFSIKDFIWEAAGNRMFITTPKDYQVILKPLTAMVMSIAVNATMSIRQPRVGFLKYATIADEFATMGPCPSLQELGREGRKYGSTICLGLQSSPQLLELMKENEATAFRAVFQNMYVMSAGTDAKTAEMCSKDLGEEEIYDMSESTSVGAAASSDGKSNSHKRERIPNVMPSEIMQLAPLTGFMRPAGGYDIAKVKFPYTKRNSIAPGLVPRTDLELNLRRAVPPEPSRTFDIVA